MHTLTRLFPCFACCLLTFATAERVVAEENPIYVISTSHGDITVEIFADTAPISARNFGDYVKAGAYDGTIFHRVISNFMIQGGGYTVDMKKKPTNRPIKNESNNGLKNEKLTLAMARTGDPDSATSQFFINVTDNGFLNREEARDGFGYAVFGKVIAGQDVVEKIRNVSTKSIPSMGMTDVPAEPVVMKKVALKQEQKQEAK